MDFKDLVNQTKRTPAQVQADNENKLYQEYAAQANKILEYIKKQILQKAHAGVAFEGVPQTLTLYEDVCNFNIVTNNEYKHHEDMFYNRTDTTYTIYEVRDMNRLRAVFNILQQNARLEGIVVSDPFILCTIYDYKEKVINRNAKKHEKYHIENNELYARVKTVVRRECILFGLFYSDYHGETAKLALALDYTYNA